jgi:CheY-like chemotaxis protein
VAGALLVASDGREAMGVADDIDSSKVPCPDLVVLDINLPVFSGLEVLERLRASPVLREIPIVVLTTGAVASDAQAAAELGAARFLHKPMLLEGYPPIASELKRLILPNRQQAGTAACN